MVASGTAVGAAVGATGAEVAAGVQAFSRVAADMPPANARNWRLDKFFLGAWDIDSSFGRSKSTDIYREFYAPAVPVMILQSILLFLLKIEI